MMNILQRLVYLIGKRSRYIRIVYHKKTNGRWLWGIFRYIRDNPMNIDSNQMTSLPEWKFEEFIERIFNND